MAIEVVTSAAPKGSVVPLHEGPLVLDPNAPRDIAQKFVFQLFFRESRRTLVHHDGTFYSWNGKCYAEMEPALIRTELYRFLDNAVRASGESNVRFKPRRAQVNDVVDALKAVVHLGLNNRPPAWLGQAPVPASEILACRNGLLRLPSGLLIPHTPEFFCHNALDFDFDPQAPAPVSWMSFLNQLWPQDAESIAVLQELFGLCLTIETLYQKAFMIIGPRRSGKGTIARVLTELIGRNNVVAPTLTSMGEQFGPASLIGKKVAIISDARINKRANLYRIAERLLSITGEDTQTIDRKYLSPWTGKLPTRFIVLSNELPEFDENSDALAGRFITLSLKRSFYGQEDPKLTDKLISELPGILSWSIEGWRRLTQRGRFIQPRSGAELASELENLSSPIKAFVEEHCVVGPDQSVPCKKLYRRWSAWNEDNCTGKVPPPNQFSRNLRAVVPGISTSQPRTEDQRVRVFIGIGLRS